MGPMPAGQCELHLDCGKVFVAFAGHQHIALSLICMLLLDSKVVRYQLTVVVAFLAQVQQE